MNTRKLILIAAIAAATAASAFAGPRGQGFGAGDCPRAQSATTTANVSRRADASAWAAQRARYLGERLGLSDAQKTEVEAIFIANAATLPAAREQMHQAISAVLTNDQRARWTPGAMNRVKTSPRGPGGMHRSMQRPMKGNGSGTCPRAVQG
ncbi:MAG: hypothetical protein ACPGU7_03590 [Gammaproteobacteria bacterium]